MQRFNPIQGCCPPCCMPYFSCARVTIESLNGHIPVPTLPRFASDVGFVFNDWRWIGHEGDGIGRIDTDVRLASSDGRCTWTFHYVTKIIRPSAFVPFGVQEVFHADTADIIAIYSTCKPAAVVILTKVLNADDEVVGTARVTYNPGYCEQCSFSELPPKVCFAFGVPMVQPYYTALDFENPLKITLDWYDDLTTAPRPVTDFYRTGSGYFGYKLVHMKSWCQALPNEFDMYMFIWWHPCQNPDAYWCGTNQLHGGCTYFTGFEHIAHISDSDASINNYFQLGDYDGTLPGFTGIGPLVGRWTKHFTAATICVGISNPAYDLTLDITVGECDAPSPMRLPGPGLRSKQVITGISKGRAVELGRGPGTELKKMLEELGAVGHQGCNCDAHAFQMNHWGAEGCVKHRLEIAEWLRQSAQALSKELKAEPDPIESFLPLVDEAIRRSEG